MSPHENAKLVSIDLDSSGKLHFLKSLSVNDFKTLWQCANEKERGKATTSAQKAPVLDENVVEASLGDTSSFREVTRDCKKHKRKEPEETHELNDVDREDDLPNEKKQRVVWTDWMHHKFLEAIEQLGHERAFPKKIVEVMNVPGLTRENVASHLQKYRMCMKRAQEGLQSTGSRYGTNLKTHFKGTFFPTSHSAPNFNSCLPHLEASTSTSNLGHPHGHNVSSLDAIAQNNTIFLDFGTSQLTPQTGPTQVDPGYVPGGPVSNINSKTILSGIESTGSSSNPNRTPSSCTCSTYVGYRLSGNGKSVECGQMGGVSSSDEIDYIPRQQPFLAGNGKSVESGQLGVLGNDENRIDKANLLVQFPSTSINYIPQQQPFLAGNGKSVESGQIGVFGNDENKTDKSNLLVQFPSTAIDYIPQQQPFLAGNGKSVEFGQMGVLGNDENRTDKANLLVQFPSTSIDYIPQQQPSLAGKGKSVESSQIGVLGNDENRTGKANLSTEGSGNESLVEFPSTSIDYIPQQQPSLASNGKSVESSQMCISGIDENRTDKANLSAQGNGNESLVQYPSMSIDDIPQRQPPLPPFPSILVEFDSFKAENEMDVLLNATWKSTSPQIFWNVDFDDTLFSYTD